jgi:site-specific recombinase XerD
MSIILKDALANYTESLRQEHKANATVIAYTKDIDQFNEFLGQQQKPPPMW